MYYILTVSTTVLYLSLIYLEGYSPLFFQILNKCSKFKIKYLLALLNSKLCYLWLYYRGKRKGNTLELYATPLGNIPIKYIDSDAQDVFVSLVDELIFVTGKLMECKLPNQRDLYALKRDSLQGKIDSLVYELYDLTDEEIDFVESCL